MDRLLSVVRDCLFNIFAATLHIEGHSSIRNLRTPHAVVTGTHFWWGNLREKDHLGDPGVDGRIILRWIFRKLDVGVWTGSIWVRIRTGGEHL